MRNNLSATIALQRNEGMVNLPSPLSLSTTRALQSLVWFSCIKNKIQICFRSHTFDPEINILEEILLGFKIKWNQIPSFQIPKFKSLEYLIHHLSKYTINSLFA